MDVLYGQAYLIVNVRAQHVQLSWGCSECLVAIDAKGCLPWLSCCADMQIKVERMAQESRVQNAMQEQERQFGRMTRSISGAVSADCLSASRPGTTGPNNYTADTLAGLDFEVGRPPCLVLETAVLEEAKGATCWCDLESFQPTDPNATCRAAIGC